MLVNMNDVLRPAKRNRYAVGLFNAVNLELARGIINAAEEDILQLPGEQYGYKISSGACCPASGVFCQNFFVYLLMKLIQTKVKLMLLCLNRHVSAPFSLWMAFMLFTVSIYPEEVFASSINIYGKKK